jgi:carboxyl-terminal processing protease
MFAALPRPGHARTPAVSVHFVGIHRLPVLAIAAASLLAGCAPGPPTPGQASAPRAAESYDPAVGVATFDTVWTVVNRTFWDTTFYGLDWPGVRDELRPEAAAVETDRELRGIIQQMLGRLGLSHFGLIPREADRAAAGGDGGEPSPGDAGLQVRAIGGAFLVTHVDTGGAAYDAGVRPGWLLERAGALDAAEWLRTLSRQPDGGGRLVDLYVWTQASRALSGQVGDTVQAVFSDARDRRVAVPLVLRPTPGVRTRLGQLPEMTASLTHRRVRTRARADVGVIRMSVWMPVLAPAFDAAVDAFRDADGVVVDLRGNIGGVGFMAAGAAGHFMAHGDTLGTMITRSDRLHFYINPRRSTTDGRVVQPFAGPLAVLVDGVSASTSEFFAGGLQALGRARVFGTPTAGQALPAQLRRLPNGDALMYAIADFVGRGGVRWEGEGVVPDVLAPPTREALLAGRDPALEAALRWIEEEAAGSARSHRPPADRSPDP